jgi:hypothetical protein
VRRGLVPGARHHPPALAVLARRLRRQPAPGAGRRVDEPCLLDLRAALCTLHVDYAALTDHDDTMADEDFATLFSMRGDDER